MRIFVKEDGGKKRTLMADYKESQHIDSAPRKCVPPPPQGLVAAVKETYEMCMAVPHAVKSQLFVELPSEAFFYPQRIWMGFASSGLMLGLWVIKTDDYRDCLTEKLATFHFQAQELVMEGIRQLSENFVLVEPTIVTNNNTQLIASYNVVRNLADLMEDLKKDVEGALWTGQIFAITLWATGWISMFLNFRNDALKLRRGDYPFDLHKDRAPYISDACAYAGLQMATATIGYLLQTILFFILSFLFWQDTIFRLLVGLWDKVVAILIPVVLTLVAKQIFGKYLLADLNAIKHYAGWSLYDLSISYATAVTGIVSGALRIFLALLFSFLALNHLDKDVLPEWANEVMILDTPHKAYAALLLLYNAQNHPMLVVFRDMVMDHATRLRDAKTLSSAETDKSCPKTVRDRCTCHACEQRARMLRFRWFNAITLITNGPACEFEKSFYTIVAPSRFASRKETDENGKPRRRGRVMMDIHKFWFVPTKLVKDLNPLPMKHNTARSPFWTCAAKGDDLRQEEFLISVEYRMHCDYRVHAPQWQAPQRAEPYKGRWTFLSFKCDAATVYEYFDRSHLCWDGSLDMWNKASDRRDDWRGNPTTEVEQKPSGPENTWFSKMDNVQEQARKVVQELERAAPEVVIDRPI